MLPPARGRCVDQCRLLHDVGGDHQDPRFPDHQRREDLRSAFEALFGGFRQRATATFQLLSSRRSTFLVVATPQHDALREAAYFVDRLSEEDMPISGMVINRVHTSALAISPERALSLAGYPAGASTPLEVEALRRHANLMRLIATESHQMERFAWARPGHCPDPGSVLAD